MSEQYELGILCVHGIGGQQRGDTLLEFGEPLIESLADWLGEGVVVLRDTDLLAPAIGEPAHTYATVTVHGVSRHVVVAESWWAETFHPPRWAPLAGWLRWAIPFVVFRALDHRVGMIATNTSIDQHTAGGPVWLWRQVDRVARNALSAALALLLTIVIALLGIVALIPAARRFILSAQTLLVRYIGDSFSLLISPGRADAMVSEVESDLDWLERQLPSHVVILAHSQGAEIVRRVLERRPGNTPIASLVTFGSGIAKLRAVRLMYGKRLKALFAYFLRVVAAVLTVAPVPVGIWIGVVPGVAAIAGVVLAALLIGWGRRILKAIVLADDLAGDLHIGPHQVERWLDFYATSDAVPEGELPLAGLGLAKTSSTPIANRRSPFLDHTSYWQNGEAFRPAVIEELAHHLGWPLSPAQSGRVISARTTRSKSTRALVAARLSLGVPAAAACAVGLLGAHWFSFWDHVGRNVAPVAGWAAGIVHDGAEKWLEGGVGEDGVSAACVVLTALAMYGLFVLVWNAAAAARERRVFS